MLPEPEIVEDDCALSVSDTVPVPTHADRSFWAADSVTDCDAWADWAPKSWPAVPPKLVPPSLAESVVFSLRLGLTTSGWKPGPCSDRVPLTWALTLLGAPSRFSTFTSLVSVPSLMIWMPVSVPSDGLNWAIVCVALPPVGKEAK